MLSSVGKLQILWWSQHRNSITSWDYLGSLSIEISFFTLHFSCSPKNMTETDNNHSGLCQDICIARSSEKVCWTCFIIHMASDELAPSLTSRKDRSLFQAILWKTTSQDSALTAPEWQAGKAMSRLCRGETASG